MDSLKEIIATRDPMTIAAAVIELAHAYGESITAQGEPEALRPWYMSPQGQFFVYTRYAAEAQELMDFILRDDGTVMVLGSSEK